MSGRRVRVGSHHLSLLEYGAGPALLYLHGSGDQGDLLPVHRDLGTHLRVLRPDLPGFGASDDLPPGARGATLSGSGPTVIVWADRPDTCAAALATRFPEHDVLRLAVAPRGAL
jgi:pimeloyl-ACP methyl ester carboxylesterase